MARQKRVYDTDEIAHLWAHQTQESARNPRGNFYFNGDTIYSYGGHFPIARHVTVKVRGEERKCILFTTRTYSVSTSRHLSLTREAIPRTVKVFRVYNVRLEPAEQFKALHAIVDEYRNALENAKSKPARVKAWQAFRSVAIAADEFAEFFGYRKRCQLPDAEECRQWQRIAAEYDAQSTERSERAQSAAKVRRERKSAAWKAECEERARIRSMKDEEKTAEWRAGRLSSNNLPWECGTILRISADGQEVETSKGARFPVDHALRVLPIVERIIERGESWQTNGQTIHLGHYTLDRIDADGSIHAGCHDVPKDEVLRLIAELKQLATV